VSEQLVTARAVAEQLGMSVAWVLDRFEAGELPGFKYGDSAAAPVRFRLSELEDWLESRRRGPRLLDGQVQEAGR
jgi:predicted DNA-binding transcriptional regulator AlpA